MRTALSLVVLVGCSGAPVEAEPEVESALGRRCESTCTASPPGAKTAFATTEGGLPFHWQPCGACVVVTLDPNLDENARAAAPALVRAWSQAVFPGLCLELDAAPRAVEEQAKNRIHIAVFPNDVMWLSRANLTTNTTGQLIAAGIEVARGAAFERAAGHALGQALGLGREGDPNRSALHFASSLGTPGPDDIASLQAMYGTGWCASR